MKKNQTKSPAVNGAAKQFTRQRLSQAVALACFAVASSNAPVYAGTGGCPSSGANTISGSVGKCMMDNGDSVTVTSTGVVSVGSEGAVVADGVNINGITNNGSIISDYYGIYVYGGSVVNGDLVNNGALDVGYHGFYVYNSVVSGNITNTGTIDDGAGATTQGGIYVYNSSVTGSISNSGKINASERGVYVMNSSVGGNIVNSGTIESGYAGFYIYNSNVGGSFNNSGTIITDSAGLYLFKSNVSGDVVNSGKIDSTAGERGIYLYYSSVGGNVTNTGTIHSDYAGIYVQQTLVQGDVTNSGTIISDSYHGLYTGNATILGDVVNSGTIMANYHGIYLNESTVVGDLVNSGTILSTGAIGDEHGIYLSETNISGDLINSGVIHSDEGAIYLYNSPVGGSIINTGTIISDNYRGIYLYGTGSSVGGSIINEGLIDAGDSGIYIYGLGTITPVGGDIINSGTILSSDARGIYLSRVLVGGDVINSGKIESYYAGIYLYANTVVGDVINSGTAVSSDGHGLYIGSSNIAGSVINSGTLDGYSAGLYIYESSIAGDVTNSGTILVSSGNGYRGVYIGDTSIGGSFINSGVIHAVSGDYDGVYMGNVTIGGDFTNSGTISSVDEQGVYLYHTTISGNFNNSGLIAGGIDTQYGVGVYMYQSTVVGDFTNSGTIYGAGSSGLYLYSGTIIGDLVNDGVVGGLTSGLYLYGSSSVIGNVVNNGTIFSEDGTTEALHVTGSAGAITNNGTIIGGAYIDSANDVGFTNNGILYSTGTFASYVDDDYTQSAGGVFRFDAQDAATFGTLTIGGTGTFAAGTGLQVGIDPNTSTVAAGDTLNDVITAGTLSASSFTIGDNVLALGFNAVIDGNTVDLTAFDTGLTTILAATKAAGYSGGLGGAKVLDDMYAADPFGELAFAFGSFNTAREVADGVENVMPVLSGGLAFASLSIPQPVLDIIKDRQDAINGVSSGNDYLSNISNKHLWFKPFGAWADQDDDDGTSGYDIESYGAAFGVDGDIDAKWNAGIAGAYIKSDVESDLALGSHEVDVETFMLKVYATYAWDSNTNINLQAGFADSDYDSSRHLFTNAIASADYGGTHYMASAEVSRNYIKNDQTTLTPYVFVDYHYVDVDSYTETGGGIFNLNVGSDDEDSLVIGIGARGTHNVSKEFLLTGDAYLGYDTEANRTGLTAGFAGGGARFSVSGIEPSEILYGLGIGAKYTLNNNTDITARYSYDGREDYDDQSVSVNIRWAF